MADSSIARGVSMPYLVDGNNLAHALRLSHDGVADRAQCARLVSSFTRGSGARVTLVFDGPAPEGKDRLGADARVTLRFGEGRSADELILRFLETSKTPRDFTVVTSDKSLGDKARHRGARVERADEFAKRLRSTTLRGGDETKSEPMESQAERDAWLAAFSRRRS